MEPVTITHLERSGNGWQATVEVGREDIPEDQVTFNVQLDDDYFEELTGGAISPEMLIEESFTYLLEHESIDSILRNFDLDEIGQYFPSFEKDIKKRITGGK